MKKYKILPHTADVRLKIEGTTLEELFEAGLQGMNDIIKKEKVKVKNDGGEFKSVEVVKKINLSATDTTSLLIDFLSEALTYSQEERAVFTKVLFSDLDEKNIAAEIYGQTVDDFGEDIKAVTYHEANVVKNNRGNWETVIIFDI
ncbi:MAG: hypothetical protein A3J63_04520 [Candidatus Moranbacteria bacterium RIFCSPHIGHO2_02_FULL_40_12b]|nr:MAG: hypothetical protein A3J63_04520 [Candidatus Moranbacteria bacterium RIFCSPHIGHO2_02_FULL_40_12b]OGI23876.1 MAG: hypothetical protein A3E91_00595 [Candidatus Moranbacteria bacterium RIFCSPHIGHO2_12_FULL_40_10]